MEGFREKFKSYEKETLISILPEEVKVYLYKLIDERNAWDFLNKMEAFEEECASIANDIQMCQKKYCEGSKNCSNCLVNKKRQKFVEAHRRVKNKKKNLHLEFLKEISGRKITC